MAPTGYELWDYHQRRDKQNPQRKRFFLLLAGMRTLFDDGNQVLASLAGAGASLCDVVHTDSFFIEFLRSRRSQAAALLVRSHMRLEGLGC